MKMSTGMVCPDTWVYSPRPGWRGGVGELGETTSTREASCERGKSSLGTRKEGF